MFRYLSIIGAAWQTVWQSLITVDGTQPRASGSFVLENQDLYYHDCKFRAICETCPHFLPAHFTF